MKVVLVVEDSPDLAMLVQIQFGLDADFIVVEEDVADIPHAVSVASSTDPDLIVLDHKLEGDLTGLEGASMLKDVAPHAKIILFSASEELRHPAAEEPCIDAFLLKTHMDRLVPLSRRLLDLG